MESINIQEEVEFTGTMRDIFRRIKVNIEFSGLGQKSICISSSVANEGKTVMALGIAKAYAEEDGKKVLLLDADIRNSIMNLKLGYSSRLKGLTECITGKIAMEDAVYQTNIDGLYLTPCGRKTNNSTQLFQRKTFESFMKYVKERFDVIIVDTPPVGIIIDAAVIASLSDACLMVAGANMVHRKDIKANIQTLKKANKNFLGVVLNKSKDKIRPDNSYKS